MLEEAAHFDVGVDHIRGFAKPLLIRRERIGCLGASQQAHNQPIADAEARKHCAATGLSYSAPEWPCENSEGKD